MVAQEEKKLQIEREMEEKRQKREHEQENKMQAMFGNVMQQMMTMCGAILQTPPQHPPYMAQQPTPHPSQPLPPIPRPYSPYTAQHPSLTIHTQCTHSHHPLYTRHMTRMIKVTEIVIVFTVGLHYNHYCTHIVGLHCCVNLLA